MTVVGVMFPFLWTPNELLTSIGRSALRSLVGIRRLGYCIIGVALWKDFGWYVMVYIAGLSTISRDLFDSAKWMVRTPFSSSSISSSPA